MSNPNMPIGKVETTEGTILVERADGGREMLAPGAEVFQGDVIETGDDGHVSLLMADQSQFSLGAEGRMTMDELVYDAEAQEGSALISVDVGVFVFISGMIAKTSVDAMVISTPAMTMGIRGTKLIGRAGPEGHENAVTLLEEAGGHVGEITVFNQVGVQVLNQANQTLRVAGAEVDLLPPMVVTSMVVDEMYRAPTAATAPRSDQRSFDGTMRDDGNDDNGDEASSSATEDVAPETAAEVSAVLVEEVGQIFHLQNAVTTDAAESPSESAVFADDYRDDVPAFRHRHVSEDAAEALDEPMAVVANMAPIVHERVRLDNTLGTLANDLQNAEVPTETTFESPLALTAPFNESLIGEPLEIVALAESGNELDASTPVDPIVEAPVVSEAAESLINLAKANTPASTETPETTATESAGTEGTSLTADMGDPSDPSLATPSNDGTVEAGGSSASPDAPMAPESEMNQAHEPATQCNRHVPLEDIARAWQQAAGDKVPETPAEWLLDVIDAGRLDFGDHNPATAEDARVLFQASQIATRIAHGHAPDHAHSHAHAHAPGKHDGHGKDHGQRRGHMNDDAHGHPHPHGHQRGEPAAEPGYVSAPAPDGPAAPLSEVQLT